MIRNYMYPSTAERPVQQGHKLVQLMSFWATKHNRTNHYASGCWWVNRTESKAESFKKTKDGFGSKNLPEKAGFEMQMEVLALFLSHPRNSTKSKASILESLLLGIGSGAQRNGFTVDLPCLLTFPNLEKSHQIHFTELQSPGQSKMAWKNYQLD